MAETTAPPSLEEIPTQECLRLVAAFGVGRFAVALPEQAPLVVPVNYVLDGDVIVFRTEPGAKVTGLRQQPASFQIDLIDPYHRTGWSVLIQGIAYEATPSEVEHLELAPWVGERQRWVRLIPDVVTGRRIRLAEIVSDGRGYL
jgi:uncharacterized protein